MGAYDFAPQRSGAWLSLRAGRLTASNMAAAMDFKKNGQEGADRIALKKIILAERMTGDVVPRYVNSAMEWGNLVEADAVAAYEEATGNKTELCGFIEHPFIEWLGASPDRFLGDDGLLEVKGPTTTTHISWVLAGEVPAQHHAQMLCQLAVTGRRFVDFASFDPRVKNPVHRLFIRRFEPTVAQIKEIEAAAILFLDEVEKMFDQISRTEMA